MSVREHRSGSHALCPARDTPPTPRSRSSPCHPPAPERCVWGFLRLGLQQLPLLCCHIVDRCLVCCQSTCCHASCRHIVISVFSRPANQPIQHFQHKLPRSNRWPSSYLPEPCGMGFGTSTAKLCQAFCRQGSAVGAQFSGSSLPESIVADQSPQSFVKKRVTRF